MRLRPIRDFSLVNRKIYDNLRFAHICVLLDTLRAVQLDRTSHIRRLFSESAEGFDEVVSFLRRLGMIVSEGQSLRLSVDWTTADSSLRRSQVLQRLMSKRNRYRSEIFRFLNNFRVLDGELAYLSSIQNRSAESGVRNFLMDMEIVNYVADTDKYILMPEYASLYAYARDNAKFVSPSLLMRHVDAKNDIGTAAEEAIVEFERKRLGPSHMDFVEHIAKRNSAAGYDIRSISIDANGQAVPRFIEVKAVPAKSLRFFWSRNEVNVARGLAHWYHLYLLPLDRNGQFDIEGLNVIADPCSIVLQESSNWIIESDAIICQLRSNLDNQ